jgi:hypothetical protein
MNPSFWGFPKEDLNAAQALEGRERKPEEGELLATACVKEMVLRAGDKKRVTPSNGNEHVGPAARSPQETPRRTLLPKPVKSLV